MKHIKNTVSIVLIAVLVVGLLFGCDSAPEDTALEPFDVEWGITQEEAAAKLKCAYYTNERQPGCVYVANSENDDTLQAFSATPSLILYEFNLQMDGSDALRLGKVIYKFSEDDYDQILADLDKKYGQRYFEGAMWGTSNSNIYLFEDGNICIEYSTSPLENPEAVGADTRDRYVALSNMNYSNMQKNTSASLDLYFTLWKYSTASTDFVLTDNSQ